MTETTAPAPRPTIAEPPIFRLFIAGEWIEAGAGRTFESVNPADTRDVIGHFQAGDAADAARAVRAAELALPAWRRTPAPKRGEILYRFGQLMADNKERLARAMTREMGKVLAEARGDVQEGIDIAFLMAGEGRRLFGDTTPSELPDKWAMSIREPIGVAGIITPWNFPIAIPCWKMMPALVAGNSVVLKPSSDTPHCATLLVEIMAQAGFPDGTVNLVTGAGAEVGDALVTSPDVQVISFTGNTATGKRIAELAARRLKRVSLELGGKNGIVVLADADLDLATDGILWSAFGTTGQRCTACSRVIVEEAVVRPLLERLESRTKALRLGSGLEATTDVGPLVHAAALDKVASYVEIGSREAELVCGGARSTAPASSTVTSSSRRSSAWCSPWTESHRRRSSGQCCRSSRSRTIPPRSRRSTRPATDSARRSSRATRTPRSGRCATSRPGSCTSMPGRSAPRPISRSAGRRRPATAIARPVMRRSTRIPSGSRSTSTSAAGFSARRSTTSPIESSGLDA
jgi:aldehyde dehydrogenase (NAD+)